MGDENDVIKLASARVQKIGGHDSTYVGQKKALVAVKKQLEWYKLVDRLRNDKKPTVLFFYGPPGVGKTELARQIAQAIHDKDIEELTEAGLFKKFDMGQFNSDYSMNQFFGAPPGLEGGDGELYQSMISNPNAVILLDELDKLGGPGRNNYKTRVTDSLLPVLDNNGHVKSNQNQGCQVAYTAGATFVITSNYRNEAEIRSDFGGTSSPFMDRIDALIEFSDFTDDDKKSLVRNVYKGLEVNFQLAPLDEKVLGELMQLVLIKCGTQGWSARTASQSIKDLILKSLFKPEEMAEFLADAVVDMWRNAKSGSKAGAGEPLSRFGELEVTLGKGKSGKYLIENFIPQDRKKKYSNVKKDGYDDWIDALCDETIRSALRTEMSKLLSKLVKPNQEEVSSSKVKRLIPWRITLQFSKVDSKGARKVNEPNNSTDKSMHWFFIKTVDAPSVPPDLDSSQSSIPIQPAQCTHCGGSGLASSPRESLPFTESSSTSLPPRVAAATSGNASGDTSSTVSVQVTSAPSRQALAHKKAETTKEQEERTEPSKQALAHKKAETTKEQEERKLREEAETREQEERKLREEAEAREQEERKQREEVERELAKAEKLQDGMFKSVFRTLALTLLAICAVALAPIVIPAIVALVAKAGFAILVVLLVVLVVALVVGIIACFMYGPGVLAQKAWQVIKAIAGGFVGWTLFFVFAIIWYKVCLGWNLVGTFYVVNQVVAILLFIFLLDAETREYACKKIKQRYGLAWDSKKSRSSKHADDEAEHVSPDPRLKQKYGQAWGFKKARSPKYADGEAEHVLPESTSNYHTIDLERQQASS